MSVVVLSRLGPAGEAKIVAAGSLSQMRSTLGCGAPSTRCWPDVRTVPGDLLLAVTVQGCQPVVSVTGFLRDQQHLLVSIDHSSVPSGACDAAAPVIWLLGVPLAQLPQHALMSVEADGGGALLGGGDVTTSVRLPIPPAGAPAAYPASLMADVTPPGWVPVDFGDAQVSVPSDWSVGYDPACPAPGAAGAVYVGQAGWDKCPVTAASTPTVTLAPDSPARSSPLAEPPETTVNGIALFGAMSSTGAGTFDVPELGVVITVRGNDADAVLMTVTHSPLSVALADGPGPGVPKSWRWVTEDGFRVALPTSWPTVTGNVEGPMCGSGIVLVEPDRLLLDSDQYQGPVSCPMALPPHTPQTPANGLVIDLHPHISTHWPPGVGGLRYCLALDGVDACPFSPGRPAPENLPLAETDILFVQLAVHGHAGFPLLEIGLGGNGMLARTILYSVHAA